MDQQEGSWPALLHDSFPNSFHSFFLASLESVLELKGVDSQPTKPSLFPHRSTPNACSRRHDVGSYVVYRALENVPTPSPYFAPLCISFRDDGAGSLLNGLQSAVTWCGIRSLWG